MKKRAAGILAASFALGLLGTCPAASAAGHNPYADVPHSDWSYSAVESLIDQGLVTGMTVDDYHNLKRLTRNDLAVYIAQAVSQRENANAKNRDLIYRLVKAYAYELHSIGVDDEFVPEPPQDKKEVDTRPDIYKKLDRITLQGWAYIRQNHYESSGASMGRQRTLTHLTENGLDVSLGYTYKLNDNWSFIGSADFYRNLNHEDSTANLNMKSMYLLGHMHGYDLRVGHYDPSNGLGMVFSDSIDGVEVQWGGRWRSTFSFGHQAADDPHKAGADNSGSSYAGWESLDYSVPRTNLPWYLADSATGYSTLAQIRTGQKVVVVKDNTVKVVDANSADAQAGGQVIGVDKALEGTQEYVGQDVNGRWGDDELYEKRSRPDVLSYRVHGMMGHGTWGGLGFYYLTRGNVELYQDPQRHALYYGFFAGSRLSRKVSTTVQASYGKNTALPNRSCLGGGAMDRRLAYSFRYQYGNSSIDKPGSWSLFALYQYYPRLASYAGTSDDWHKNEKGIRLGGEYTFDKGFLLNYYGQWTHDLDTHGFAREFRAQMNWVF